MAHVFNQNATLNNKKSKIQIANFRISIKVILI
jgi:hypothetical protein